MSLREGYLSDYLVASFIGLAFGAAVAIPTIFVVGNWGTYIGAIFVAGIFGFIPSGFTASYINFRFHRMGENKEMAGLSAGFFAAFVYLVIDLFVTLTFAIIYTFNSGNYFIAWIISFVFGFIFMPIGGYLEGFLEGRPFAMPTFFDLSSISRGAPPPPPPTPTAQVCFTCRKPLTFVQQYDRWYCTNCKKYP
jgi:MFS family permease